MKQSTISGTKGQVEDFASLAKEIGYVKARQHLKRLAVQGHQDKIAEVDKLEMSKKAPYRLKASIELSATLGEPLLENPIVLLLYAHNIHFSNHFSVYSQDKMMEAAARKIVPKAGQTQQEAEQEFSVETFLKQSLNTNELMISHMKIGSLPLNMGDTLFLQVSVIC